VAAERPCWREFTKLVPNHVFRDKDLEVLLAIMNHESPTHELGDNRAGASPCLDRLLRAGFSLLLNLGVQAGVDERTLFQRPAHSCPSVRQ